MCFGHGPAPPGCSLKGNKIADKAQHGTRKRGEPRYKMWQSACGIMLLTKRSRAPVEAPCSGWTSPKKAMWIWMRGGIGVCFCRKAACLCHLDDSEKLLVCEQALIQRTSKRNQSLQWPTLQIVNRIKIRLFSFYLNPQTYS